MIFGMKEKLLILTHTMYCWLLLQIWICGPGSHISISLFFEHINVILTHQYFGFHHNLDEYST